MRSTIHLFSRPAQVVGLLLLLSAAPGRGQAAPTGTLTPVGAPIDPVRVDAGGACIVDLTQAYEMGGTLTGRLEADYRILVAGPCGAPPGTYAEQWIAHGTFSGAMGGEPATGTFWYTARVGAGGAVEGRLAFDGIAADLEVRGNLFDGRLTYAGRPGPDPVELNHVVITVDSATYAEILASEFLADEFAAGGVMTVTADSGETWTGRYIVGRNLYLEVFGPGGSEGRTPGDVGLAFSTTSLGDIDTVFGRLTRATGPEAYRFLRHRRVEGDDRPWFHAVSVGPPSPDRRLGAWIMESHPDHLARLGLPRDRMPTRAAYLSALGRSLGAPDLPPDRLLQDVTRIDLVLTPSEAGDLADLLGAGGWSRDETGPGAIRLSRYGLVIRIATDPSPDQRLRAITFTLTRPPDREHDLSLGRSVLTLPGDRTARWTFRPQSRRGGGGP